MNKLAAGFLFLLMPFNSQNSSVICFHIVKEGPSGRTEGVASPTFLPLPKGSEWYQAILVGSCSFSKPPLQDHLSFVSKDILTFGAVSSICFA